MGRIDLSVRICNGRLKQIGQSFRVVRAGKRQAVFQCACGSRIITTTFDVSSGQALSCGCSRKETNSLRLTIHGHSSGGRRSPTFVTWSQMINRCSEKATGKARSNYYDRGIRVCDRWLKFENFLEDMGERPVGLTLDRENNNGDYSKENCRWATRSEQQRNCRNSVMIPFNGILTCAATVAEIVGMNRNLLSERLRNGWSPEKAISTPVRKQKNGQ